jgi:hypothetical protein
MSQDIWVVVETLRNEVLEISYTMLVAGRELADGLGGDLRALILGHQTEELAGSLGVADHITYVDHPCLADFTWGTQRGTPSYRAFWAYFYGHGRSLQCRPSVGCSADHLVPNGQI